MVDTQHFCLRWNNYQSSITSAFENLRDDEDFVDVTLACDGKSLKAHRVVLSACSPYFRELLKSTPCKHPVIVLQDVAWTDLHALVEFIYHGEVNVHQRSLSSFLKTAEVLRVSGLTQQHGDAREQLAQVQNMVRSQQLQQQPISNHHHASFTEKLVEESLFPSPSSPPHASNVNQLLRKAVAMQYRKDRRISADPEAEHKRARAAAAADHLMGNHNNNNNNNELNLTHTQPPQTQPADFSPTGMKNNALNLNLNSGMKNEIEGNGTGDRDPSPCSPSPTLHSRSLDPGDATSTNLKTEPMELLCAGGPDGENSDDSTAENGTTSDTMGNGPPIAGLPQGPHSGSSGGGGGGGGMDHDDRESAISPYLTPTESKLFATAAAAGGFNFSMAALTGDPAGLGGLNQSLHGSDSLAGTSQAPTADRLQTYHHHHHQLQLNATAGHRCEHCGKTLSTKLTLKRHKEQQHLQPLNSAVCTLCHKVFRTLNSLNNHRSIYHRRQK